MEKSKFHSGIPTVTVSAVISVISLTVCLLTVGMVLIYGGRIEAENHALREIIGKLSTQMDALKVSGHDIKKRDAAEDEIQPESLLNQLSLADLMGLQGPPGLNGRDGKDGRDGENGRDGRDCTDNHDTTILSQILEEIRSPCEESTQSLSGKVNELAKIVNDSLAVHQRGSGDKSGVNYIRWGRTTCPASAELIYEGFVGGQYYDHLGGAADRVCLPLDPEWSNYDTAANSDSNYIYGTEYEVNTGGPQGIFSGQLDDQNAPCAACYSAGRNSVLMVPAKRNCPDGTWTKEYEGYLMTEKYTHKASAPYVCVDADPVAIEGLHANENGATLHFVQANCKYTGHCPPYVNYAELTCVVCTK